jgi:rhodanese-related sulfurtransferase
MSLRNSCTATIVRMPFGGLCAPLLAVVAAATLGGCNKRVNDNDIVRIDLPQVRSLTGGDDAAFVDPRSTREYDAGHIPGAKNISLTEIPIENPRVPASLSGFDSLIVYGNDPGSPVARAMAKRLMITGHKGVYWYEGGIGDWKAAGQRIEVTALPDAPTETKP